MTPKGSQGTATSETKTNATSRPTCAKHGFVLRRVYAQVVSPLTKLSTNVTLPAYFCGEPRETLVGKPPKDHVVYDYDGSSGCGVRLMTIAERATWEAGRRASHEKALSKALKAEWSGPEHALNWIGARKALKTRDDEAAATKTARREKAEAAETARAERKAARDASKPSTSVLRRAASKAEAKARSALKSASGK